ncbi:MAG: hypothetical protein JST68_21915 [Bacteroidetes bacterium]|nr:hypothetical protein [Bacteroidota bacterium]
MESINELARKDLIYIQSALVLSRSVFETLIKVAWMLYPPDVFECEARYVAHLGTERDFYSKWIKEFNRTGGDSNKYKDLFEMISGFKDELSKLLKEKGYTIPKIPNVREALMSLNEERKYIYYILLSQYAHSTHYASNMYRKNLGTEKILNENVRMEEWKLVFAMCWPVFELATEFYIYRTQGREELYTIEFKEKVRDSFLKIT